MAMSKGAGKKFAKLGREIYKMQKKRGSLLSQIGSNCLPIENRGEDSGLSTKKRRSHFR